MPTVDYQSYSQTVARSGQVTPSANSGSARIREATPSPETYIISDEPVTQRPQRPPVQATNTDVQPATVNIIANILNTLSSWLALLDWKTVTIAFLLVIVIGQHFGWSIPLPSWLFGSPAYHVGKNYRQSVLNAEGAAWKAGADQIDLGHTMQAAADTVIKNFDDTRNAAFKRECKPFFESINPGGAEPKSVQERIKIRQAWYDFGSGVEHKIGWWP